MTVAYRLPGTLESLDAETVMLWEAGCTGLLQDGAEVVAYFPSPVELPLPGRWEDVPDTDWLAAYYRDLRPVVLPGLVVAPSHHEVMAEPGQVVVRLDPGMAFGTGHHETTRLALRELLRLDLAGKRVLDVGSGSGILAIAASLLGARDVLGLDTDAATLPVAERNRDVNGARVRFVHGSLGEQAEQDQGTDEEVAAGSVDVLVANLYAELHVLLAPAYARVLRPGGTLLVTGILAERLPGVLDALGVHFDTLQVTAEGEWRLVRGRRP